MLSRVIISLIAGIIAAGLCYIVGIVFTLVPFVQPVGVFLELIAPVVGLLTFLLYLITGRSTIL